MKQFAKKNVVVTGGSRGIGFAIARLFVSEGANVFITGQSSERVKSALEKLRQKAEDKEQVIECAAFDVASYDEVKKFADTYLEKLSGIDVLINCAGITKDNLLMKLEERDWESVIDTNAKSVFNLTKAFIRTMIKKRSGRIINVASVVGVIGNPGQTNYAASKAAMIGFTKSLAKEVASRGITVNCIAPGFIETEMTDKLTEEQKKAIVRRVPMARMGEPSEIAHAAVFLASDRAAYITGQTLVIDGGMIC